jgi:hypothetical protein
MGRESLSLVHWHSQSLKYQKLNIFRTNESEFSFIKDSVSWNALRTHDQMHFVTVSLWQCFPDECSLLVFLLFSLVPSKHLCIDVMLVLWRLLIIEWDGLSWDNYSVCHSRSVGHSCGRDGVSWTICPGWPQTVILPSSVSQVARIVGMNHWHPAFIYILNPVLEFDFKQIIVKWKAYTFILITYTKP